MRIPRIYNANLPIQANAEVVLDSFGANHVSKVLRLKTGDKIFVFDGCGNEFEAILTSTGKTTIATLQAKIERTTESPIQVELLQVISRGDRMDFTIQKAVELGISKIVPLTSSRCGVKLDADRADKKIESYQRIAISACEQCGRARVPEVTPLTSLSAFVKAHSCDTSNPLLSAVATPNTYPDSGAHTGDDASTVFDAHSDTAYSPNSARTLADAEGFINLTLDPRADRKITDLPSTGKYRILIGPEGGFADDEVELARRAGFIGVTLGPRILRTETAALVTLSILGSHFGDL